MFTSVQPAPGVKRHFTFIASFCLQLAVLLIFCGFPQVSGPSIRHSSTHSVSSTPIYFQDDAAATSSAVAPVAESRPATESKPPADRDVKSQDEKDDVDDKSASNEEAGSVPSWQMDSMPSSFSMMHHQVSTAQPVFTPEPPVLHSGVHELVRGKDVVLEIVIDNQGSISQVSILQGVGEGVEDLIIQTLRLWTFVPAKFDGVGVTSRRQLRFHFPD